MDILAKIVFGSYVLLILAGGIMAVTSTSLVRALVGLIATLMGVAGMYLLMASPFMAFMQLLIYVGAVTVLIFLAVMLTKASADGEESGARSLRQARLAAGTMLLPGLVLAALVITHPAKSKQVPVETDIAALGQGLLGQYTLPFELISIVLVVAMAGAVLMAWEGRK
jgi:NADH-quinone oxidoreductase subunit J